MHIKKSWSAKLFRNFGRELFTIPHSIKTRWRLPVSSYFSHILWFKSILLTVIKVTFLNRVNIYLQDVPVISVRLVVILVRFFVISVIPGDFDNSWHRFGRPRRFRPGSGCNRKSSIFPPSCARGPVPLIQPTKHVFRWNKRWKLCIHWTRIEKRVLIGWQRITILRVSSSQTLYSDFCHNKNTALSYLICKIKIIKKINQTQYLVIDSNTMLQMKNYNDLLYKDLLWHTILSNRLVNAISYI